MAIKIEDALQIIYKKVSKKNTKLLPIEKALGFVLAKDIVATHNLPPYDNSAMDGYAVKLQDASKCVKVQDTIYAGDNSNHILKNEFAIKIMTGAKIPESTECIVPIEDVKECINGILLPEKLKESKHIRFCGEDIKRGDTILEKGDRLNAHKITLLASQGISHIKVYKKPIVALFGSGNELKMHFENLTSYQLYNTNTPTFSARALEFGCEVEFIGTAEDNLQDIKEHIKSAKDADLIITSGGASVGDADFTKEAFGDYEVFFDKIEIKPGKPTTFGRLENSFVLNLPGNPLAAALNFELFGQSIILALSGVNSKYINYMKAKIKNDYNFKVGRRTLIPGFFDGEFFEPCKKFAPGMISPLANANAYMITDNNYESFIKNQEVKIISTIFNFTSKKLQNLINLSQK
jgi:molybdopterin molybdotransferase